MKRFEYSLQKILDFREFTENQAEMDLARALSELERIAAELRETAEERVRSSARRGECKTVPEMTAVEQYILRLDVRREELLVRHAEAELAVEEKRSVLAEAMKKRKVLSKLREKRETEYKKDAQRAEDFAIDDIVSPRSSRHDTE